MKKIFAIGLTVLVLSFGLAFTGCDGDDNNGNRPKLCTDCANALSACICLAAEQNFQKNDVNFTIKPFDEMLKTDMQNVRNNYEALLTLEFTSALKKAKDGGIDKVVINLKKELAAAAFSRAGKELTIDIQYNAAAAQINALFDEIKDYIAFEPVVRKIPLNFASSPEHYLTSPENKVQNILQFRFHRMNSFVQ